MLEVEDMDTSYYAWNFFGDDASNGYYSEMDYEFGDPIGDYTNIQESVYVHQFENATVVVNISPTLIHTVDIGGNS